MPSHLEVAVAQLDRSRFFAFGRRIDTTADDAPSGAFRRGSTETRQVGAATR
jgi:hypothetical protein